MNQRFVFKTIEEKLTPIGGMTAVGAWIAQTKLNARLNAQVLSGRPKPQIPNGDVVSSYVGLLCQGKNDFDHIEAFRDDEFFQLSLGLTAIPSSPTLRQRLDEGAQNPKWMTIIQEENTRLLTQAKPHLQEITASGHIPLDLDVSIFDNSGSKKEGLGWTYLRTMGYAPMFAYLGKEGFCVAVELRNGSTHCQKGTPAFLRKAIQQAQQITSNPLVVRLDSGHHSRENLAIFFEQNVNFIVKRNLHKETPESWKAIAQEQAVVAQSMKDGLTRYYGKVTWWFVLRETNY
ncbi:IS1380 family transposase [Sporomusa sphaeroides]|uniref:Transposase DDE domain-containing protein n=1 Tax=Sporomusa sphaeroides DSM 2875 TaxID=1337886 RepID=A0ABP2CA18_9FIRM|nr:IS1380 family transposase [Sporomusa sphaeroides]OLS56899.1 hypothetical protein SPSPH_03950 [Sporomusa sphaeroides DSM 2875]CVK21193.1 hypothetical protein SSPH_03876 [Sporomusa sphaeroides DSM 2875]